MVVVKLVEGIYYKASYGFNFKDEVAQSSPPSGWVMVDNWMGVVETPKISETEYNETHRMAAYLYDTGAGEIAEAKQTFTDGAQEYGTVELWFIQATRIDEVNSYWGLDAASTNRVVYLRQKDGDLERYTGVAWISIGAAEVEEDEWYHLRIDFERTAGAYQGLAQNTYQIELNGVSYGAWALINNEDIDKFIVGLESDLYEFPKTYIDAVGYSWDPDYTVGDNKYAESYYYGSDIIDDIIDFKITTELGKISKAVTRIKKQTLLSDSIIAVDDIYTSWQQGRGIYKESLDFKNETLGSAPSGTGQGTWTENHGANCDSYIIDKFNGHVYVLQIEDYNAATLAQINHAFTSSQTNGTIEWYMAASNTTKDFYIALRDGSNRLFRVYFFVDGNIYYRGSGGSFDSGVSYSVGEWIKIKVIFDCVPDTYDLYINDVEIATDIAFENNSTAATILRIHTSSSNINNLYFIDAIGYSWDTDYTVGDNANYEVTLSNQTIFEGQITKQSREAIQKFNLISKTQELNQPVGEESAEIIIDADYSPNMINQMMGNYNHATATEQDEIVRATYNFLNDSNNAIPFGVLDVSEGTGTMEILTASLGSHKNYIHVDHADANHGAFKIFFEAQTSGVIEWLVRTSNVAAGMTEMFFYDSGGVVKLKLTIQGSKHKWYDGVALTIGSGASTNTWYHYRLSFDCATDTFSLWVDDNPEAVDADFFAVSADIGQLRCEASHDIGNPTFDSYFDGYGFTWDWRYPECRTYNIGDNKQILVDEIEPSGIGAIAADTIILAGDVAAQKVIKDFSDKELMIWYLNISNEICMDDGTNDSQIDFSSTDKIWAVKGSDRIQRINKVVVKGGIDADPKRVYATANNTDSQTTYGVKLITVFVTELLDDTDDLQAIADNILAKHENAPDQVVLWRDCRTEGMMQVGETITISASDIEYSRNSAYIAAGQWIIRKIIYYPLTQFAKFWLIDSLIYEPDEDDLKFIEKIVNQGV